MQFLQKAALYFPRDDQAQQASKWLVFLEILMQEKPDTGRIVTAIVLAKKCFKLEIYLLTEI